MVSSCALLRNTTSVTANMRRPFAQNGKRNELLKTYHGFILIDRFLILRPLDNTHFKVELDDQLKQHDSNLPKKP